MEEDFDYQGKRPDQVAGSGKIVFYSFIIVIITLLLNSIFDFL